MGPIRITLDEADHGLNSFSVADPRCRIETNPDIGDNRSTIYIDPKAGSDCFPVFIQFEANQPIEGVGFLPKDGSNSIPKHHKRGHCGGCFFLECHIDPTSRTTPLIRDDGPSEEHPHVEYRFALWVGGNRIEIDPQIYNQGVGDDDGKENFLLRFFRRLWRLLTSRLR